jgi:uncharacterized integral membrane protein
MIQRKQTLWLLLAAACAICSFIYPFYAGNLSSGEQSHLLNARETVWITLVTGLIAVVALATLFMYKKRVVQIRLCIGGILLELILIFLYYLQTRNYIPGTGTYAITALLQAAILFLFFLAARDINKDEKKVRDSDRLR